MRLAWPRFGAPELKLFHTRSLSGMIVLAAAMAAFISAAYWTSGLISPGPVVALPSRVEAPRNANNEQNIARIFGIQPGGVDAGLDGLALTGVFAPNTGGGGFATFRTAKGNAGVTVGQEIIPGLRLARVESTRAIISSGSGERIMELPKPKFDKLGDEKTVAPKPAQAGPD